MPSRPSVSDNPVSQVCATNRNRPVSFQITIRYKRFTVWPAIDMNLAAVYLSISGKAMQLKRCTCRYLE